MTLLQRQLDFVTALREAGLDISVAETVDAAAALEAIDLLQRDQLRAALAAALAKRAAQRPVFDALFDLFWPPVTGGSASTDGAQPMTPAVSSPAPGRLDDPLRDRLRADVAGVLAVGDDAALVRAARDAVTAFGAVPGRRPGQTSWSALATLQRVSPRTLLAGLLDNVLAGTLRGGFAEREARALLDRRLADFERHVAADVRRRLADVSGPAAVARTTAPVSVDRLRFLGAGRSELAAMRREIQPLARRLATRLAQDQRRGTRGALDVRATVRASLSTGGVPMTTRHRPRRPRRTDLVVLCDVSESVSTFARFTLMLVYALREQFTRVRAFAFVDELAEITRFFEPGLDVTDAVAQLTAEADVVGLVGRTDYGRAFRLLAERFDDAVGPRTSLLVLGDARSNYGDLGLPALSTLVGRARRAYWLNPERRALWDTGDSGASRYAAVLPMAECGDLAQLGAFVQLLGRTGAA